jgi:hypothetical protein
MKLPAPPPSTIWQDMAEFQRFAEDIQARITDPGQKKLLGDMLQQLSVARARAQEVVPGVLENMKKEAEAHQAEVPKMAAELERLQAELEAKRTEAERLAGQARVAAAPPESPLDPNKGWQLTDELRQRFAPSVSPVETPFEDAGSVAREWVDPEAAEAAPPPPVTPARPATMRPAPKKPADPDSAKETPDEGENDIWEGLSRMEGD